MTDTYENAGHFKPAPNSAYLFSQSDEARSRHIELQLSAGSDVLPILVKDAGTFEVETTINGATNKCSLRSQDALRDVWQAQKRKSWYLDITGIPHHVWAPILKSLLESVDDLMVTYVEPKAYRKSATPTEGHIYDLSERIQGISPIPCFASLAELSTERFVFVPLLGFEGARFSYLLEQVQPGTDQAIPVIGVPGFQAEYPFETYWGNKRPLEESEAWRNVRFAPANCPFSIVRELLAISRERPRQVLKIGLIGTKPHALGAVLYKIIWDNTAELVYDHPIRKSDRTDGTGRLLVYHLSSVMGKQDSSRTGVA